jgi:hypothetical protein
MLKSLNNKYVKYPYACAHCNALTPHTLVKNQRDKVVPEASKAEWVFAFFTNVFFRMEFGYSSYNDREQWFRCDKCGNCAKH